MAITVSISNYELPNEGPQAAVLADVIDLGIVDSKFGKKHKVNFVWILAEKDTQDKQKRVYERFTLSLNEKAGLRKRLTQLGAKFDAKTKDFDVEQYVGTQATLVITYNDGDGGKKFANVLAAMKATQEVTLPEGFVRQCDRKDA